MSTIVEVARQEWAEGHRRLEAERADPARYGLLRGQVDAVLAQLSRRIGSVFTIAELAAEYGRAERWVRETVAELPPEARWQPEATTAADAAFHLYARGAKDHEP